MKSTLVTIKFFNLTSETEKELIKTEKRFIGVTSKKAVEKAIKNLQDYYTGVPEIGKPKFDSREVEIEFETIVRK